MIRAIVASLFLTGLIFFNFYELNKRRISTSEFVFWQSISLILIGLLVFPNTGQSISEGLGFELLANLVFSVVILVLLVIVRIQSRLIHRIKSQIQRIVEEIALDEKKIK
jgi:hypothetical protein